MDIPITFNWTVQFLEGPPEAARRKARKFAKKFWPSCTIRTSTPEPQSITLREFEAKV